MTLSNRSILWLFLTASFGIITSSYFIIHSEVFLSKTNILSTAVTADITLIIPLLYFLIIRKRRVPRTSVIPVFIICVAIASQLIPEENQTFIKIIEFLLAPLEILVVSYIIYKVVQIRKEFKSNKTGSFDYILTLKSVLMKFIPMERVVNILATEISVLYYAMLGWNSNCEINKSQVSFTYHKKNGYITIFGLFIFLIPLETTLFHLLISQWSVAAAWILTILSFYGVFFLLGDINAVRKRPIYLTDNSVVIRIGLRWYTDVPFDYIAEIEKTSSKKVNNDSHILKASLLNDFNIEVKLKNNLQAVGLYGITKTYRTIFLRIDNPELFIKSIRSKLIS